MTDLCFEDDAEAQCDACVREALQVAPEMPEVQQTLASFLLSKQQWYEARETLVSSIRSWMSSGVMQDRMEKAVAADWKVHEYIDAVAASMETADNDQEMMETDQDGRDVPSYAVRMALVKLLVECKLYALALVVLETLENEDDEVLGLWQVYAMMFYCAGAEIILRMPNNTDKSGEEEDPMAVVEDYLEQVASGAVSLDKNVHLCWREALDAIDEFHLLKERMPVVEDDAMVEEVAQLEMSLRKVISDDKYDQQGR